ncbi:type II secretion system F family protein [Pararhizobium mangrovi]|uniref:Type II secretion system F family protein n=1 Tax=Pararhizobium mangrovi TaxID=2590452 RepID=A0A506UE12_9HYPH|nr:type II secretion system F family protein [Pararhizobium mangrovi]TPW32673.1 type II secretion system F family protein [Pararhizobium mangrovi]
MFGPGLNVVVLTLLVAVAVAAVLYALLFSRFESAKRTDGRMRRVKDAHTDRANAKAARERMTEANKRRKSVQDSLKGLEERQKEDSRTKAPPLKDRIRQAGLSLSTQQFVIFSAIAGFFFAFVTLIAGLPIYVVAGAAIVAGLGLPRWVIGFLRKRRLGAFMNEFPNALDIMVRSIRSGLPLPDAMRLIASDGQEPVKTEFQRVVESQQMGMSVPDACARMYKNIPLPEANFFAIVIAIQAQAGGNLSEALGNLSRVLRDRKKMKAKVQALSMEAKASAAIIGSLPFIVATLVYLTSPDYMTVLFTDVRGHLILGASAVWMTIGILVMRNMINFEV